MKDIFETPESKRSFGEGLWDFDPTRAVEWIAKAWAQEHGKLTEHRARHDAWKAQEPRYVDLMPADEALGLLARRDEAREKARAEMEKMYPGLFERR